MVSFFAPGDFVKIFNGNGSRHPLRIDNRSSPDLESNNESSSFFDDDVLLVVAVLRDQRLAYREPQVAEAVLFLLSSSGTMGWVDSKWMVKESL